MRRFEVTAEGRPIERLNDLEMVNGELFANVWGADVIARIDPASGKVVGWIDLTGLLPPGMRGTSNPDAVLNGPATPRLPGNALFTNQVVGYDRPHTRSRPMLLDRQEGRA